MKYSGEEPADRCGIFAAIGQECLKNEGRWDVCISGEAMRSVQSEFLDSISRRRLDRGLIDTLA